MFSSINVFEARKEGYKTYRVPGITVSKNDVVLVTAESRPISGGDWEVDFFINNLTDERAEIYLTDGFFDYFFGRGRVYTNRPREMGIRYKKSF